MDVVVGEPFDFVFHRWNTGVVMEGLLLMYQGELKAMRSILDCILCRIFVLDGLAQPQSCTP